MRNKRNKKHGAAPVRDKIPLTRSFSASVLTLYITLLQGHPLVKIKVVNDDNGGGGPKETST